ncbi:MAG: glycosyltransferase family 2 protein [Bacteroidales bacterium]|nr:glycosyltransferase family 2 protein [Bacteroidales bacterium]
MKISVIVPTYKPKDYLWECLDSLVAQTFPKDEFEVILVLNGCEEPWKSKVERYIVDNMKGVNVNLIHTLQSGVSNARNIALDIAKGEYIAFVDDDDFVSKTYLSALYEKVSQDTISLCYPYAFNDGYLQCQLPYRITEQYARTSGKGKQHYRNATKFFSGPCMKLIPASYIQERRFDVKFKNGEDSLFMFLLSDKFKYVDFTEKDAIYYRRYRDNSAIIKKRSMNERLFNSLSSIILYLKIYFSSPTKYNGVFLLTRILGTVKSII